MKQVSYVAVCVISEQKTRTSRSNIRKRKCVKQKNDD